MNYIIIEYILHYNNAEHYAPHPLPLFFMILFFLLFHKEDSQTNDDCNGTNEYYPPAKADLPRLSP